MAGELQDGAVAFFTQSEFSWVNDCLCLEILIFQQVCDTINYQDCFGLFREVLRTSPRSIPSASPSCHLYGTWANFRVEDSKTGVRMVLWFFFMVLFGKAVNGWQR